jgi:hypothetical protein
LEILTLASAFNILADFSALAERSPVARVSASTFVAFAIEARVCALEGFINYQLITLLPFHLYVLGIHSALFVLLGNALIALFVMLNYIQQ